MFVANAASRPRWSRFGYASAALGVILGVAWGAVALGVQAYPEAFADHDWLAMMPYLMFVPVALVVLGLKFAAQFRTAESIADWSDRHEAAGKSVTLPLVVSTLYGGLCLLYASRHVLGDMRTPRDDGASAVDVGQLIFLMPFLIFVVAAGINIRSKYLHGTHADAVKASQRPLIVLTALIPVLILGFYVAHIYVFA